MHLATLLIQSLTIDVCIFLFFLTGWLTRRDRAMYGWIAASAGFFAIAFVLLLLRGTVADYLSIWLANTLLILAESVRWAATRSFEGRRFSFALMVLGPLAWTISCLVPAIYADIFNRIAAYSVICGVIDLAVARDLLLGWRREPTGSRAFYISAVILHALANFARLSALFEQNANNWSLGVSGALTAVYVLESTVHLVAITIGMTMMERDRAEARQRKAAATDVLTGVMNRRAFFESATDWIEHKGKPAALLLFDLDHFKSINDTFGHAGGDAALIAFAKLVQDRTDCAKLMADFNLDASTCGQDPDWYASICIISAKGAEPVFGRLGGEEFACLLPHLTLVQGLAIAEDIRSAVTLLPVCYGQEQIRLSVSCSVSSTIDAGQNLEALLSSADDALYRAKRNGRNRVEAASQKAVSDEPIFA